jgi:hypothetical protein
MEKGHVEGIDCKNIMGSLMKQPGIKFAAVARKVSFATHFAIVWVSRAFRMLSSPNTSEAVLMPAILMFSP